MEWKQIRLNLWQIDCDFFIIQCHELDNYGFVLSVIEQKENDAFRFILTPTEIIDLCQYNNIKYTMKYLGETLTTGERIVSYVIQKFQK
jgi:hypothetical protein